MRKKTIDKKTIREAAIFYFLCGLVDRPGLCQGCEILKTFLHKHKYASSAPISIISFWNNVDSKYMLPLKPLFRLGKHEMPCMSFKINCLFRLKKIANALDGAEKIYYELKNKINNNIDQLKHSLGGAVKLRKQTWDAFLGLTVLQCGCVRLANKWENISKVFELPPCMSEAKSGINSNDENKVFEHLHNNLVKYNSHSKMMISMLQEYLGVLLLGQKSQLLHDQYGYRSENIYDDLKRNTVESYPLALPNKLEVRLFLLPENMEDKDRRRLKNTIFNELFEIPNLTEFISADTPPRIRSMLSGNYLTIYKSGATLTDEFPDFLKAYPVINLFCVEGKLLTKKVLHENDGENDLKINLNNDNSCLLVVHDDTKKNKKWLNKWKEQRKLKHYIELTETDGENLFSRITNLVEREKLNEGSHDHDSENNIHRLTYLFDEERYKSLHYMTILFEMAIHVYFGVENSLESEPASSESWIIHHLNKCEYERKKQALRDILSFKPVVQTLIRRSLKKIEFEDIPKHFLQPTIARKGKRLATSWFVGKDGHNTRNTAVLIALGKAVIDFIQNGTITEETHIAKEIRNIDDRLRRLEDRILQINSSGGEKAGIKRKRNISYEDRKKIPNEELREALLVGKVKQ